jgi:hypothetical protein
LNGTWDGKNEDKVRILKIATWGHVCVLLWRPDKHVAELFDSGGFHSDYFFAKRRVQRMLPVSTHVIDVNAASL